MNMTEMVMYRWGFGYAENWGLYWDIAQRHFPLRVPKGMTIQFAGRYIHGPFDNRLRAEAYVGRQHAHFRR